MTSRAPRIGFFAYAASVAITLAVAAWQRHVIDAAIEKGGYAGLGELDHLVRLASYAYWACGVGAAGALLAVARAPRAAGVAGLARVAAVLAGVEVLLEIGEHLVLSTGASAWHAEDVDRLVRVAGGALMILYCAQVATLHVVVLRIGRASGARALSIAAIVGLAAVAVRAVLYVVAAVLGAGAPKAAGLASVEQGSFYATEGIVVLACVWAGIAVARIGGEQPASDGSISPALLATAWRAPADGIAIYLAAAAARVLCSLLDYGVMAGANGAQGVSDLRPVRDGVVMVAYLSGAATLAMLGGVWRISRAPADSGGSGPALAALVLMAMGFVLDLVTTSITVDALGGSVSAAFFAMDALPLLAAGSALLGVGAGVALLRSFGAMASALASGELAERARSTAWLLGGTGGLAALAVLGATHMPVELLVVVALLLLPLALASLVQFLRVALPLSRTIRTLLEPTPAG